MHMIYIILILVVLYMVMNKDTDGYKSRTSSVIQKPPSVAAPYRMKRMYAPPPPVIESAYEAPTINNPDGSRTRTNKDGSVTILYADGGSSNFAAGSTINPNGSVIVNNSDGTQTLQNTDGTYTLYMPGNFLSAVDHIGYPSTIGGSRRFAPANERGYPYIIPKVEYPFNNSSVEPDVIQTKMSIMKHQNGSIGQIIPS
jgi:hypothetical protein